MTFGLNMRHGTYSGAVLLAPNKSAIIRARNGADTANHNLFSYAVDDVLAVGTDARQTNLKVVDPLMANPMMRAVRYGAADSAAPGFRQLMVSN